MNKRVLLKGLLAFSVISTLALTGCGDKKPVELRVGATAGPHAANVQEAAKVAKKAGLNVKLVEFTDYITPNKSLEEGALDVVVYQHEPFLNNFNKQQGTHLKKIANAVVQPMGFYSNTIKSVEGVPEGTIVSIPNDPSNGGRALLLLQNAGLLKLKAGVEGAKATVADIVSNPKKLKIKELEAAQLPRSLDDVGIACIPMNYAISANLSPKDQGFFFESKDAPFALIIIASRENNANDENVKKFVKAFQSDEVADYITKTFKGSVIPAWK